MKGLVLLTIAVSLSTFSEESKGIPAFPGAEGFGAFTPGGRGGRVYTVTTLADSGPGSLRAACEAEGPRIVVFRISGIIELEKEIKIRRPYITIAGQSAPGQGVCIKNFPLCVSNTHDAVIRYLRVRPGDTAKKELDALPVGESENVILDHCSAYWGIDETLSVTNSKAITIQWCLIAESLNESYHKKGAHGYGSLITGPEGGQTWRHNVYAHHNSRSPRPGAPDGDFPGIILDFRNNVIYNWGMRAGYSGLTPVRINYVGNYLKPGPSTRESALKFAFRAGGVKTKIYFSENRLEGYPEETKDNSLLLGPCERITPEELRDCLVVDPFPAPPVPAEDPLTAYARILESVGASLPARDAVDARVIKSIQDGTGKIINSQNDVGGWPVYPPASPPADADGDGMPDAWETQHGLNPNDAADAGQDGDRDGYTNIEEFLNPTDRVE